jgi:type II secretory pathway component GspD/PulD (secretin)
MTEKLQQPISLDFTEVSLSDVVDFIADAANVSIIPSPQLDLKDRRVSLKVNALPLEQALKYLAKSQSLAYKITPDAVLLATAEEFANEPMETRVFFLRSGLGPFALETAAVERNPQLAMEPLKALIEQSVPQPPDSKLVIDERSGALIATNTSENLGLIERLLSQLDVTPVQVLIEARFVELTLTDLEQLGLETVLNADYGIAKKKVDGGGRAGSTIVGKDGGFKFTDLARQDEGVNLTLQGILTAMQFESVLHALEESKKTKTLSAPRVTTLNNQTALIRVVDEFNYPTRYEVSLIQFDINGDGDFDDAGETEFANVPQDLQKRDIGILLNVTPSVGRDVKTITLVLAPEVSQFSQFRDLGGGVTVPEFTSSQLTTSVVIEDGQTVVLGGLMKDTTSTQVSKLPVLGDLPLVGGMFKQSRETATRKNLLIFITARILAPRQTT